jgi:hypothetical protein
VYVCVCVRAQIIAVLECMCICLCACARTAAEARCLVLSRSALISAGNKLLVVFFLIVSDVLFLRRLMLEVQVTQSPHIEFHLKWAEGVLLNHGSHIMAERATFSASLRALHMGFSKQFGGMCKMPKLLLRCGLLHCACVCGEKPFPGPPDPCLLLYASIIRRCHFGYACVAVNSDYFSPLRQLFFSSPSTKRVLVFLCLLS